MAKMVKQREREREDWFPCWSNKRSFNTNASPQELLILGAFRYLGRGFTFDDIKESTAISKEVHSFFFMNSSKLVVQSFIIGMKF
jgi:hypothetical protein